MAFTLPVFASDDLEQLVWIGATPFGQGNNVNSAVLRYSYVFTAANTEITGFKVWHGSNTGTPSGCQADLYAVDANGFPTGSSLATVTYTPSANAVNSKSFSAAYSSAVVGTNYCIVWQNATGTPGSNYFTLHTELAQWRRGSHIVSFMAYSGDSGTNWYLSASHLCAGVTYTTTGTVASLGLITNQATNGLSLYNASGSRKAREGIAFNLNVPFEVCAIKAAFRNNTGSPTHNIGAEILSASASLATSDTVIAANALSGNVPDAVWVFDTPYACNANTTYYGVVTPTAATAGDGSNYSQLSILTGLIQPGTIGAALDGYNSTASGSPSWSQSSRIPDVMIGVRIAASAGGGGARGYLR